MEINKNKKIGVQGEEETVAEANGMFEGIIDWFKKLINLETGLSREATIIYIKNNKKLEGSNAWLLMCSIMIASLGLDLNSAAVIIGAMLISPLMSPILGVGLSVGINDRDMLYTSLKHFFIAILIALVTSTLYFYITPLGQPTKEIISRTSPNLLDGIVAVFGGLAGIISVTRKDKSNAIPGVAIATALMPPLCVTGYGIATGNSRIMMNSFYLFFLNSFFIALTTYVIVRILKFPYKNHINVKEGRQTKLIILIFSLLLIVPSIRILYTIRQDQVTKERVKSFINDSFPKNTTDFTIVSGDTLDQLIVKLIGISLPPDSIAAYDSILRVAYDLPNMRLNLIQNEYISIEEIDKMQVEVSNLNQLANQLKTTTEIKNQHEVQLKELQNMVDSLHQQSVQVNQIFKEIHTIFPDLDEIGFARMDKINEKNEEIHLPLFVVKWDEKKNDRVIKKDNEKIKAFLQTRAGLDTLDLIQY